MISFLNVTCVFFLVHCFYSHYSDDNDDGFTGPFTVIVIALAFGNVFVFMFLHNKNTTSFECAICISSSIGDHVILLVSSVMYVRK